MKYRYKDRMYSKDDLIDILKEQGKYLDRYDKIREEEEERIMQKYHPIIEGNIERILVGELLSEGVVEKREEPVSSEKPINEKKAERVRHILKEAEAWDLSSLESEGFVDRHEHLLETYAETDDYKHDWAEQTRMDLENPDEYIENYVDEEYADALIAWGKEIMSEYCRRYQLGNKKRKLERFKKGLCIMKVCGIKRLADDEVCEYHYKRRAEKGVKGYTS